MEMAIKTVILIFFICSFCNVLGAPLKNDAIQEAIIQTTIANECKKQFALNTSTTTPNAKQKRRILSLITLTKLTPGKGDAFLGNVSINDTSKNILPGRTLIPSLARDDVVFIKMECFSPFRVRIYAQPFKKKKKDLLQNNSTNNVVAGSKRGEEFSHNLFSDSLIVKVNATTAPRFLNVTCFMEETPSVPVLFSSRFTFSLKPAAMGNLDIKPDNSRMRYYAEMASTPHLIKFCAPMLPWDKKNPGQLFYDSRPEQGEGTTFFGTYIFVSLYFPIFLACLVVPIKWCSRAAPSDYYQALPIVPQGGATE